MIGFLLLLDNSVNREMDLDIEFVVIEKMESEDVDDKSLKFRWYMVYMMLK